MFAVNYVNWMRECEVIFYFACVCVNNNNVSANVKYKCRANVDYNFIKIKNAIHFKRIYAAAAEAAPQSIALCHFWTELKRFENI